MPLSGGSVTYDHRTSPALILYSGYLIRAMLYSCKDFSPPKRNPTEYESLQVYPVVHNHRSGSMHLGLQYRDTGFANTT